MKVYLLFLSLCLPASLYPTLLSLFSNFSSFSYPASLSPILDCDIIVSSNSSFIMFAFGLILLRKAWTLFSSPTSYGLNSTTTFSTKLALVLNSPWRLFCNWNKETNPNHPFLLHLYIPLVFFPPISLSFVLSPHLYVPTTLYISSISPHVHTHSIFLHLYDLIFSPTCLSLSFIISPFLQVA